MARVQRPPTSGVSIRPARDTDARAIVLLLQSEPHLEIAFDPHEFVVAEMQGQLVGCARLKRLDGSTAELASVIVLPQLRLTGVGARLVEAALAGAPCDVYALALAPEFFQRQGFRKIAEVPVVLRAKAMTVCASSGFVPMVLYR